MLKTTFRVLALSLALTTIITGCKKDDEGTQPTTNPSTGGGGGGGGGGSTITAANYAGTWTTNDGCSPGAFQITITASGSSNVSITNFRKGFNITGTVSGGTLTIPKQNVISQTQGGPFQFTGSGTLSGNSLSISYTMADGSGQYPQNCSANSTK